MNSRVLPIVSALVPRYVLPLISVRPEGFRPKYSSEIFWFLYSVERHILWIRISVFPLRHE